MNHDVFISYSEPDKSKADAVCSLLERRGIRCWIAPRDILPGATWGSSIIRAIQDSKVFVLVFSSHSNHSPQVVREVERAVRHAIPIIPFRIEPTTPTGDMEYFISAQHWLDALDPPLEAHIERLASVIKKLMSEDLEPAPERPGEKKTPSEAKPAAAVNAAIEEVKAAEETKAASVPSAASASTANAQSAALPPRVERARTPAGIVRDWRASSHSPVKPIAIAGGIVGGFFILAVFAVIVIAMVRDCEGPDDPNGPNITFPSIDSIPAGGLTQTITLTSGSYGYHDLSVPPGQTWTVTVLADSFDAVLEVWRLDRVVDDSAFQPEVVVLEEGGWEVAVESYNNTRSGGFEFNVVDETGRVLVNSLEMLTPGGRTSQEILVPSGSTRRVTVSSSNFDVVLRIFAKVDRKDATVAGSPEEIVLSQPGDWEVTVKSYDTRTGDYTITVR